MQPKACFPKTGRFSPLALLSCDGYLLWNAAFPMRRLKIVFHLLADGFCNINQDDFNERCFLQKAGLLS